MAEVLHLRAPLTPALRIALAAAGAFCLATPTWEFRTAFFSPGLWSLPFALILLGAYGVGVGFLMAAVAAEARQWRIEAGAVTLTRKSLLGTRVRRITAADLAETRIRTVEWDSRADSYSVVMGLRDGTSLETPDRPTREAAEALRRSILEALRSAG